MHVGSGQLSEIGGVDMTVGLILIIIVVILLMWFTLTNIRVVPQGQAYVIENLGKFKTVWDAGLHIKMPFVEKVAKKVSLKEQVLVYVRR